jgi:hypothetical protein
MADSTSAASATAQDPTASTTAGEGATAQPKASGDQGMLISAFSPCNYTNRKRRFVFRIEERNSKSKAVMSASLSPPPMDEELDAAWTQLFGNAGFRGALLHARPCRMFMEPY